MLDVIKLAEALPKVVGRTIHRVLLVPIGEDQHQVVFVFSDGTYYELYGTGQLSGARVVDSGTLNDVRAIYARRSPGAVEVSHWGAGTPHIFREYLDGRRRLVEANGGRGHLSIVSLLPDPPRAWTAVSDLISQSPAPVRMLSDIACELLLADGRVLGTEPRLELGGFLGSGGEHIAATTLIPAIALWARAPWQRKAAIRSFERTVADWQEAGFALPPGLGERVEDPEVALCGFLPNDEIPNPEWVEEFVVAARRILNGQEVPRRPAGPRSFRGAVTGRSLNHEHGLGAAHSLYHKDGTWYERLVRFPGILCDAHGFVRYDSEADFLSDPRLRIGQQVNVNGALADHPRYRRFEDE